MEKDHIQRILLEYGLRSPSTGQPVIPACRLQRGHLQPQDVTRPPGPSVRRASSGWRAGAGAGSGSQVDRSTWPTPVHNIKNKANLVMRHVHTIFLIFWSS